MLSKKRQKQILKVVSDILFKAFEEFKENPELWSEYEKGMADALGGTDASINDKLTELFKSWKPEQQTKEHKT